MMISLPYTLRDELCDLVTTAAYPEVLDDPDGVPGAEAISA
jgi:hypothetical protein